MRKVIMLTVLILSGLWAFGQDLITTKQGDVIKCKIFQVTPIEVYYMPKGYYGGDTSLMLKSDIFMVTYKGGRKEVFANETQQAPASNSSAMVKPSIHSSQQTGQGTTTQQDDIITTRKGDVYKCRITEVTPTEVHYAMKDKSGEQSYSMFKTDIFMVNYKEGRKELFAEDGGGSPVASPAPDNAPAQQYGNNQGYTNQQQPSYAPQQPMNTFADPYANGNTNMKDRGKEDALLYYRGYRGAVGGTVCVSLFVSPLAGLIPAISTSSKTPNIAHLNAPHPELFENDEYRRSYTLEAHRIKKRKVWTGYAIGSACCLIIAGIITASVAAGN